MDLVLFTLLLELLDLNLNVKKGRTEFRGNFGTALHRIYNRKYEARCLQWTLYLYVWVHLTIFGQYREYDSYCLARSPFLGKAVVGNEGLFS